MTISLINTYSLVDVSILALTHIITYNIIKTSLMYILELLCRYSFWFICTTRYTTNYIIVKFGDYQNEPSWKLVGDPWFTIIIIIIKIFVEIHNSTCFFVNYNIKMNLRYILLRIVQVTFSVNFSINKKIQITF